MPFELSSVSFSYTKKKVIDDISMAFAPGRFCGIIGPNGCGKTTLLDLLAKHRKPTGGRIVYKGKDLGSYSTKELSTEIALVPQNFYINFPFTVKEVVMMGRYPHIPRFSAPSAEDVDIVQEIMEKTGVSEFTGRFITELSGGERQRVVFARALAQDTHVLILDEATSNLDINHSISLVEYLRKTYAATENDHNFRDAGYQPGGGLLRLSGIYVQGTDCHPRRHQRRSQLGYDP